MTTLLESKARPYGSRKGVALSVIIHGALVVGAIIGTRTVALPAPEKVEEHPILYVATPPPKVYVAPDPLPEVKKPPREKSRRPEPPRAKTPPPRRAPAPAPRTTPQPQPLVPSTPMVAPVNVPTSVPKVDLNAIPTTTDVQVPETSSGALVARTSTGTAGSADGDVETGSRGGLGSGNSGRAYSENQVERTVQVTRAVAPTYPEALRSVNVEGEVMVQYIVDARGRVEPGSIKILSTSHRLFADAVRKALLDMRFRAAEVGGRPVRQLVEQPFQFKLNR